MSFMLAVDINLNREKYLIIMNIFESVAHNTNSHVDQVRGGHFKDLLGELLTILIDLLHTVTDTFTTITTLNV